MARDPVRDQLPSNRRRRADEEGLCTCELCRQIFTDIQYGSILQTRWPSRKYADSRRFLYLTFDSPVRLPRCFC